MVVSKVEFSHSNAIALFFGLGLIGNTFYELIHKKFICQDESLPFDWDKQEQTTLEIQQIIQKIVDLKDEKTDKIDIFWTAGKGGFEESDLVLQQEMEKFKAGVSLLIHSLSALFPQKITLHFFSSAGGLFEGQSYIHEHSVPQPLRPYGQLKLDQENYLKSFENNCNIFIYRPSTVYGYKKNGRSGLIKKILLDSIQGKTVQIFASINALRDYILVDDIAQFLLYNFKGYHAAEKTHCFFLVSGKPSPIYEILQAVKKIVRKSIFTQYTSVKNNSLDITFSRNLIPEALQITPITQGIELTYRKMKIDQ